MPSYLVTGASRGLGFGFISHLSANPGNIVIGFVRSLESAQKKVEQELPKRKNLHIVRGDLDDYASLQQAFKETSKITGGSLDYLIANAAVSANTMDSLTVLGEDPAALEKEAVDTFRTNVVGNINLVNLALPLLEKGKDKKVVILSSGLGDTALTADYEVFETATYSISKAALDMVTAKFHAGHKQNGFLFMGISPGVVDTQAPPEQELPADVQQKIGSFFGKFKKYAPEWQGPITVEESVKRVLGVVDGATIEKNGGKTVSHLGTRQWL